MRTANSTDDYLEVLAEPIRQALSDLRATIADAAPEAEEAISYQMPTFTYRGRPLVYFAAFKDHCSFFPASGTILDTFAKELAPFRTSKGTLRFSPDEPIPKRLIQRIVKARLKEIDAAAKA